MTLNKNRSNNKKTIISIAGSYWTGSSALLDLLNKNEYFYSPPGEFSLFSYGQYFSDVIKPLITDDYSNIINFQDNLYRYIEFNKKEDILFLPYRKILRTILRKFKIYPKRLNAIRAGYYNLMSKEYFFYSERLLAALCEKKECKNKSEAKIEENLSQLLFNMQPSGKDMKSPNILLDQFISPAYVEDAISVLPEVKMIFIDRDWRDQYTEIKKLLPSMIQKNSNLNVFPMGETAEEYTFNNIDFFIMLRNKIHNFKKLHKKSFSSQVLWLNFEDLIYRPSDTLLKVLDFLGLSDYELKKFEMTFLEKSKKNIGKWKTSGLEKDIRYIKTRIEID